MKKYRFFSIFIVIVIIISCFNMITSFAETPTRWNEIQGNCNEFVANEDGSVSVSTVGKDNAFNSAVYVGGNGLDSDVVYSFSADLKDNGIDQPITIAYGILGTPYVYNITLFYQSFGGDRIWTNAVCGGTSFGYDTVVYKMTVDGATVTASSAADIGFDKFILSVAGKGMNTIAEGTNHYFTIRAKGNEDGATIYIYYQKSLDDDLINILSVTIIDGSEGNAKNVEASFIGFQSYQSEFTLSNAVVEKYNPDPSTYISNWNVASPSATVAVLNEQGDVRVKSALDINYSVYTTTNGVDADDITFSFSAKVKNNGLIEQPLVFSYGIIPTGYFYNIILYYQGASTTNKFWTNAVATTTFDNASFFMSSDTYTATASSYLEVNDWDFGGSGTYILPISEQGLLPVEEANTLRFKIRVQRNSNGATITLLFKDSVKALYREVISVKITDNNPNEVENARNTASSFLGFQALKSEFVLSNVSCEITPKEQDIDPDIKPEPDPEPDPVVPVEEEGCISSINGSTLFGVLFIPAAILIIKRRFSFK